MGWLDEFKEFALKGSVVDMAVGVILGFAFGRVVTSVVEDLLSPPLGLLFGAEDLVNQFWVLRGGSYDTLAAAQADGAVVLSYGQFLSVLLEFLLVALALFVFVRFINRKRREAEAAPPPPERKRCPYCTTEMPLAATRCPACTSDVPETPADAGASEG